MSEAALIVAAILELTKTLMQASIRLSDVAGIPPEEQEAMFQKERDEFYKNTPDKLNEV